MSSVQDKPSVDSASDVLECSRSIQASWITTTKEFASLEGEWSELFDEVRVQNVFLSFEWMFTWWKHWGGNRHLAIIVIRDASGRMIGLAPFCIRRGFPEGGGARRLCFLADEHVGSDYLGILARTGWQESVIDAVVSSVQRHRGEWDYIELRDAGDGSFLTGLCNGLEANGMRARRVPASICRYIQLPSSFDEYLARIGIKLRRNYRARLRALERMGPAETVVVADPAGLERHFPELLQLHQKRFEQRKMASAFTRPGVFPFQTEMLKAAAARGWARLLLFRSCGRTVAALYGFSIGTMFQFYQCGMHPEFLHHGVGQVMVGSSIREAILAGHSEFDFLRGNEQYKAHWADLSRQTVTVRLFDRRPSSFFSQASYAVLDSMRKAKRRILAMRPSPPRE